MDIKIRSASPSPYISEGVLHWYEGDTFTLNLILSLEAMGMDYTPVSGDTLEAKFFDDCGHLVKEFSKIDISSGTAQLVFDTLTSAKLQKGRYTYDLVVCFGDGSRTTVAADNCAVVM